MRLGMGAMVERLKTTARETVGSLALGEAMDAPRARGDAPPRSATAPRATRAAATSFCSRLRTQERAKRKAQTSQTSHFWRDTLLPRDETVVARFAPCGASARRGGADDDVELALVLRMAREVRTGVDARLRGRAGRRHGPGVGPVRGGRVGRVVPFTAAEDTRTRVETPQTPCPSRNWSPR